MGNGPDIIYPPENKGLHDSIIENGSVITEFPPGMPPLRQNFPIRNRIISGISRGAIIVEAGRRSGAMITGELSLEQDREVFAVPGSIFSSSSRGCHRLIKSGAKLVDRIEDILEEFQELFKYKRTGGRGTGREEKSRSVAALSGDAEAIYRQIGYNAVSLEELAINSGFSVKKIINVLTDLEMDGLVKEGPSNHYSRCD
jgi:DNA processing protein